MVQTHWSTKQEKEVGWRLFHLSLLVNFNSTATVNPSPVTVTEQFKCHRINKHYTILRTRGYSHSSRRDISLAETLFSFRIFLPDWVWRWHLEAGQLGAAVSAAAVAEARRRFAATCWRTGEKGHWGREGENQIKSLHLKLNGCRHFPPKDEAIFTGPLY